MPSHHLQTEAQGEISSLLEILFSRFPFKASTLTLWDSQYTNTIIDYGSPPLIIHTNFAILLIFRGPTYKKKKKKNQGWNSLLRTMPWSNLCCVLTLELFHDRTSWNPSVETPSAPAAKRRRKTSPGPVIVIKDEPEEEDEVHFVREWLNPLEAFSFKTDYTMYRMILETLWL